MANEQVTNFHQIETEELKALPVTHSKIERLNSINVSRAIPVFSAPVLNVLMGSDGSSGSSSIHTGGGDNESLNAARRVIERERL